MDFIEGLPKVGGKSVILTVVNRFSKYAHFIPLAHPYTAETVAKAFFTSIVRLHGVLISIVSDRDVVFTSNFWKALFAASGTRLHMSTAFHPQSDGQAEAVNRVIAMYLRCLTGDRPRQWLEWLSWAEYCYNTSYHSALRDTPFRVVYGRDPPSFRDYIPGEIRNQAVERQIVDRDQFLHDMRARLLQAVQHYKHFMMASIASCLLTLVSGLGCAFTIGQQRFWVLQPRASWLLNIMALSRSSPRLTRWPIVWSYQPVPAFTMYFMWVCSRSIMGRRRKDRRHCLPFSTAVCSQRPAKPCTPACAEVCSKC